MWLHFEYFFFANQTVIEGVSRMTHSLTFRKGEKKSHESCGSFISWYLTCLAPSMRFFIFLRNNKQVNERQSRQPHPINVLKHTHTPNWRISTDTFKNIKRTLAPGAWVFLIGPWRNRSKWRMTLTYFNIIIPIYEGRCLQCQNMLTALVETAVPPSQITKMTDAPL